MMEPTNPIDILIRLLVILFFIFFGTTQSVTPPGGGGGGAPISRSLTVIENVEVITLESYPYQLMLNVSGYQPDGCQLPVLVEQRREGSTVYVQIYREVPLDMICTMQLVPYNDTIRLDGSFESGVYQITINGTVVNVNL